MSQRPSTTGHRTDRPAGRRAGYVIAVLVNAVLLWLINVSPGWQTLSWITDRFADVVWVINLSLIASIVANAIYVAYDPPRFRAACQIVISLIGLGASVLLLQVFPFDFSAYTLPWATVARVVLVIAIVGSAISVLVEVVRLVRGGTRRG